MGWRSRGVRRRERGVRVWEGGLVGACVAGERMVPVDASPTAR